jgi:hypothetical protein
MTQIDHLQDHSRRFVLTKKDLTLINPNTRTCPIFNTRRDADLSRKVYQACPILHNERTKENPWGVHFFTMFHMANDSHLFRTRKQLEEEGYKQVNNCLVRDEEAYLPLYEAKMMHQFDHRHGTYEGQSSEEIRKGFCRCLSTSEYADPYMTAQPRYWVESREVKIRISKIAGNCSWLIGFRDVTRAVDKRTVQFAILPLVGIGHKIPLIFLTNVTVNKVCAFLGNINSFALDYIARQKIGGISMSYFIVRQLPIFSPNVYKPEILSLIVPRVLELTYTAWELSSFACDCGYDGKPFQWDEDRRAYLRAELDAIYFHLYGLNRDEIDYILDTFPIVKRKDEERYGEYHTKRLILESFEQYKGKIT